jgi:hypothetical protein
MENRTRVVVYVTQVQHQRLKSKLALLNQSLSGWFRKHVEEELRGEEKKILQKNSNPLEEETSEVPRHLTYI